MSTEQPSRQSAGGPKLPTWLVVILLLGILGVSWWQNNSQPKQIELPGKVQTESSSKEADSSFQVEHQSIRDLNGRVVYQGTIDLTPTLDRIARGEANRHHNDGTVFQNRELNLPRKPNGYYKEYVHPTPGEKGSGPQRIIIGQAGEVWYTPDHYRTFKQIKSAGE